MPLDPVHFFNLKAFAHRSVFGVGEPVWKALSNLPYYLGALLAREAAHRGNGLQPQRFPHLTIDKPFETIIGDNVRFGPHVHLEGPVFIDDNARIESCAHIVGPALIGPWARIGHGAQVVGSILFPWSKIGAQCTVHDSLIGTGTELGAHLNAPSRFPEGRVRVRLADQRAIDSGLERLGLIAGDGCFFGSGLRFHPGDWYLPRARLF